MSNENTNASLLPEGLGWLADAVPAKCPDGHEMEWTDVAIDSSICTGDYVEVPDPATFERLQKEANLWEPWMRELAPGVLGRVTSLKADPARSSEGSSETAEASTNAAQTPESQTRVSQGPAALPKKPNATVRFNLKDRSRSAVFHLDRFRKHLRAGDMVHALKKLDKKVDKSAVGLLRSLDGPMSFGSVTLNGKPAVDSIASLDQLWRCASDNCCGGHVLSGTWRWRCHTCGTNACSVCRTAPVAPLRSLFHSKPPMVYSVQEALWGLFNRASPATFHQPPSKVAASIRITDWVLLKSSAPRYGLNPALVNELGVLMATQGEDCFVKFPSLPNLWKGLESELAVVEVGQRVSLKQMYIDDPSLLSLSPLPDCFSPLSANAKRGKFIGPAEPPSKRVKREEEATAGDADTQGRVSETIIGTLLHIEPDGSCYVSWGLPEAEQNRTGGIALWDRPWAGHLRELDFIVFAEGDFVMLRDGVAEPSFGFGDVQHGDIGRVTKITHASATEGASVGTNMMTANGATTLIEVFFPCQPFWHGSEDDLDLVRRGLLVSIDSSINEPRPLGWQGVSKTAVGRVVSLHKDATCFVEFPSNPRWFGKVFELHSEYYSPRPPFPPAAAPSTAVPIGPPLPAPAQIDDKQLLCSLDAIVKLNTSKDPDNARRAAFRSVHSRLQKVYDTWCMNDSTHSTYNNLYKWVMLSFAQLSKGDHVVLSDDGIKVLNKRSWPGLQEGETGVVSNVDGSPPWYACVKSRIRIETEAKVFCEQ
eukprot:gene11900-18355_t